MYGKDYAYAGTRLAESIVRLQKSGEPVFVHNMNMTGEITYTLLKDNQMCMGHCDDLDMHPVKLGYVNHKNGVSYVQRKPVRRDWKQGLRAQNCVSYNVPFRNIAFNEVRDCIMGNYPKFADALKGNRVIAFHRHWAVRKATDLLYKEQIVGLIVDGKPVLDKKFIHLKEYLEECMA